MKALEGFVKMFPKGMSQRFHAFAVDMPLWQEWFLKASRAIAWPAMVDISEKVVLAYKGA